MQNKMYVSELDKRISGVCGGISDFFGFDSTKLRIAFVILSLMTGVTILLYIALIFLMPKQNINNL